MGCGTSANGEAKKGATANVGSAASPTDTAVTPGRIIDGMLLRAKRVNAFPFSLVKTEFTIKISRAQGQALGFTAPDNTIVSLKSDGLVQEWNRYNKGLEVEVGDRIVSVNGISVADGMRAELRSSAELHITLQRYSQPLEQTTRQDALPAEMEERPYNAEQMITDLSSESKGVRVDAEKALILFGWDHHGALNALVRPRNADDILRKLTELTRAMKTDCQEFKFQNEDASQVEYLVEKTLIYFSWNDQFAKVSLQKIPFESVKTLASRIPNALQTAEERICKLMNQFGATRPESEKALIQEEWSIPAALTALEKAERKKQWRKSCALDVDFNPVEQSAAPQYWSNQDLIDDQPLMLEATSAFQNQIQQLLACTFKQVATKDRKGKVPQSLNLVQCQRIENPVLWKRYHQAKVHILRKREAGVRPVQDLDGNPEHGHVLTEKYLAAEFAERTDARINEFYLWHGTSQESAEGIARTGFKVDLAGAAYGSMFGPGAYFAECASKSDEYAKQCQSTQKFCLMLCRVICGELFRITQPRLADIRKALRSGRYDTVLGDREAARGTYREFVVYDEALIYPEYILQYERCYAMTSMDTE